MKFIFIINPHSGINKNKTLLTALLKSKIKTNYQIRKTEYAGHASILAKEALAQNYKNIIAVGGDGTMNEVAGSLVGSEAIFGLIPMGSGNGFARSLGIPLKPDKAIDLFRLKNIKKIDVGKIEGRYFFAVAGVGIDAEIAHQFQKRKIRGALPYFYIGLKELIKYQYPKFYLKSAEKNLELKPLLITIANATEFGNGAKIAPHADIQDGKLDVCIFEKMSLVNAILDIRKLFNGRISEIKGYSTFPTKTLVIKSRYKNILFHTDGEPHIAENKIKIETISNSLNVIVP